MGTGLAAMALIRSGGDWMTALTLVLAIAFAFASGPARAQLSEPEAKVALLFNVITFVEWPRDQSQLNLCQLGGDEYNSALRSIDKASVGTATLRVLRLAPGESSRGCQILFIADSNPARMGRVLDEAGPGMLTVCDSLDGVALGAMVGIGVERQRLSFNIGQTAARSAGVGISSKLLRLAGSVR